MSAAGGRAILAAATSWLVVSTMVALLQCPIFPGRQLKHLFPAFTQAQPLQEPALLHLQQTIVRSDSKKVPATLIFANGTDARRDVRTCSAAQLQIRWRCYKR